MKSLLAMAALAFALSAPLPAMAQEMDHGGHGPSSEAFMAGNHRMMEGMEMPMTGDADQDFVSMMIVHHQGAIDMAKVQLEYGKDPQLRSLAEEIIAAQEKEIAMMKQWQADHPK